ncbi:MAG: glycosyltransferase family A protein [Candidatus Gastranaerophilaceae bacterium]
MNKYKVSIIVPVYGVEKYIDKCLDSLVKQSLKEIEIIVVNDGSQDNSQKIIDKYVKRYPDKIKSYIKENGGQGSARNYGLEKANGEYIGYVDSDDFIK